MVHKKSNSLMVWSAALGLAMFTSACEAPKQVPKIMAEKMSEQTLTLDQMRALIDPELWPLAEEFLSMNFDELSDDVIRFLRDQAPMQGELPVTDIPYERRTISGLAGQADVDLYVINAKDGAAKPAILHMHGGGYVLGDVEMGLRRLQEMARALDCVIVSVEYRLAPEHHYEDSLADNYAGLKYLHDHAAEIGVDASRIAVMGESAGGGHAALLAQKARDLGEIELIAQVLVYPMLDDRTGSTKPVPAHIGFMLWNSKSNVYGWKAFLGREPGLPNGATDGVPGRVQNLAGLAPAFIGVGDIDLFVDEDIDYARRLVQAGIATELLVVPGAFHAFDQSQTAIVSKRFNQAKINYLRNAFAK